MADGEMSVMTRSEVPRTLEGGGLARRWRFNEEAVGWRHG